MKNKIVNIINFIRGIEPRFPLDLHKPVAWQMELARKYNLPTTWLLQYDALLDDFYIGLLKQAPAGHEVGIWFEVVQSLVEACGIKWRGRYPWDWHTDVGFSIGYTPEEREKLADEFIRLFREKFGYTPGSMGSWLFDAHLLKYLADRYGIESACNCKDQWGTDGYTLWGGYWANGYFPCRRNAYLPAQTEAEQIRVPVFRMLGSDPIYQYEADPGHPNGQPVITLEPVYNGHGEISFGGGCPAWVDWFFRNEFADPVMAMGYIQAGQENSFGCERMRKGLEYQYPLIAQLRDAGRIEVATLGETGRCFSARHRLTPATSVCALEDWRGCGRESIWYMSRFGRINLSREQDGTLAIRDWQLNSEKYAEPFLDKTCRTSGCTYCALPVCDGMRWECRMAFIADGVPLKTRFRQPETDGADTLRTDTADGKMTLTLCNETLDIVHHYGSFSLRMERRKDGGCFWRLHDKRTLEYEYDAVRYRLRATGAAIDLLDENRFTIHAAESRFQLSAEVI